MATKPLTEEATAVAAANKVPKTSASGRLDMSLLASGTPDGTQFIRDDGTLDHEPDATLAVRGLARLVFIDPQDFGSLGTADDTAVFQAAIDYAAGLSTKAAVICPPGTFNVSNINLKSRVDFCGHGKASKLVALAGTTGGVLQLFSPSQERLSIRNLWIEANKGVANCCGVLIDNDGGTFTSNDPWITVSGVFCSTAKLDAFRFKSRGLFVSECEAYNADNDGFAFLSGSTVGSTDGVFTQLRSDACARYGIYDAGGNNALTGGKIGEAGAIGLYLAGSATSVSGLMIDNTGYPTFAAGTPVQIDGDDNCVAGLTITRGVGNAVLLAATAARNFVRGSIAPVAGGGTLTYAVKATSGAVDNDVRLTARLAGTPAMTGRVDPASDAANNQLVVNNITEGYPSGTYTPTPVAVTNVAATTGFLGFWTRTGKIVSVTLPRLDIDPTAGSTMTTVRIPLPVASAFTAAIDAGGIGTCDLGLATSFAVGKVLADATNDAVELSFISEAGHANRSWGVSFQYTIK